MPAEKSRAARKCSLRGAADRGFRAARIGDQRVRLGGRGDCGERFDRGADRQRDVNEIGAAHGAREIGGGFSITPRAQRLFQRARAAVADQRNVGEMLSQGQGKRSADQARAEDCYATKGNCAQPSFTPAPYRADRVRARHDERHRSLLATCPPLSIPA